MPLHVTPFALPPWGPSAVGGCCCCCFSCVPQVFAVDDKKWRATLNSGGLAGMVSHVGLPP